MPSPCRNSVGGAKQVSAPANSPKPPGGRVRARFALCPGIEVLRDGGIIAYPTEGVFGLGCLAERESAVARIIALKGRTEGKGLIVIGAHPGQLLPFVGAMQAEFSRRSTAAHDRPTTWIVPASAAAGRWLTGNRDTIALRVSRHPVAAALCLGAGGAVVSTSANRAGTPPARTAREVRLRLGRQVDAVVAGACGTDPRPSRIVDLVTGEVVRP